jgi:hypothetical protein
LAVNTLTLPQPIEQNRQQNHAAQDDFLGEGVDAQQVHPEPLVLEGKEKARSLSQSW